MSNTLIKKMHKLYEESKKLGLSRIDVDVYMIVAKNITEKTGKSFSTIKWEEKATKYLGKEDYKKLYREVMESFYIYEKEEELKILEEDISNKELAIVADYLSKCVKSN